MVERLHGGLATCSIAQQLFRRLGGRPLSFREAVILIYAAALVGRPGEPQLYCHLNGPPRLRPRADARLFSMLSTIPALASCLRYAALWFPQRVRMCPLGFLM